MNSTIYQGNISTAITLILSNSFLIGIIKIDLYNLLIPCLVKYQNYFDFKKMDIDDDDRGYDIAVIGVM